jgi:hypothetical protein
MKSLLPLFHPDEIGAKEISLDRLGSQTCTDIYFSSKKAMIWKAPLRF